MKKLFIACATIQLMSATPTSHPFLDVVNNYTPVILDSPGIHFIDKMNIVDVNSIMHFIREIWYLDYGKKNKKGEYIGQFNFEGSLYSISELVTIEEKYYTDPKKIKSLKKLLDEALDKFEVISEPHLREAQGSKEYTTQLMEIWSTLRHRPDTELLEWGKNNGNEKESLRRNILTFKQFHIFLNDLALFLRDFIHSCPLSYERYKKLHEKVMAQRKAQHGTKNASSHE